MTDDEKQIPFNREAFEAGHTAAWAVVEDERARTKKFTAAVKEARALLDQCEFPDSNFCDVCHRIDDAFEEYMAGL